ncbi:MAG: hypothetical protein ACHQFW_08250, partial [Chitinophagales bacterium]
MGTQKTFRHSHDGKTSLIRILLTMVIFLIWFRTVTADNKIVLPAAFKYIYLAPDSLNEDTIPVFQNGDTIETYFDGLSTVYILYEDTSAAQDSIEMLQWAFTDNQPHILIELSDNDAEIQQGLFGFNVGNLFLPGHANAGEIGVYDPAPDPYDLLSDLKPNVLRFPAGQSGTFMQPLGSPYTSDALDPLYGYNNGGYGYDIESMIMYYDMSDGFDDVLTFYYADMLELLSDLETDIDGLTPECESCEDWIDGDLIKDFVDKYRLWRDQDKYEPDVLGPEYDDELYINEFIRLIEKIETDNPGHVVDVIYCADILSQTAGDVVNVINYLRTNSIYNVNVTAVELGNECYAKFFAKTVGFTLEDPGVPGTENDFEHYWKYINGDDYTSLTGWTNTDLEYALADDVESDHDFIFKIRGDAEAYDVKIGLPAAPHRSCDEFIFIDDDRDEEEIEELLLDPCPYPQWNIDMVGYYEEEIYAEEISDYMYVFDAVVIHFYLSPLGSTFAGLNYRDIIVPPGDNCLDGDYTADDPYEVYTDGVWDFADMDERLECAYYGLIGLGNQPGNFHEFIKNYIDDAIADHADFMEFLATDDGPEVKELWVTEQSVSAKEKDPDKEAFVGVVANSFLQAYVTQEWLMKNIKLNFVALAR